jgi:acetylornithine deacetylase
MHDSSSQIDRLLPMYRELLRDLVREPSTIGNERAAQVMLSRAVPRQGLEPRLYDLDVAVLGQHPLFAPTDVSYRGRPNLVATRVGGGGGRSLVLIGHIDVVSAEPEGWWTYAPWDVTVDGDRLYGRGAYDMKEGLVASMLALHAGARSGSALRGGVTLESVIEEECAGNGTLRQG